MNRRNSWEIIWDMFVMLMGIAIPALCSWLFIDEFVVGGAGRGALDLIPICWLAAGTFGYAIVYCALLFGYPRSKEEQLPSWYGPIRMFSLGGLWIVYLSSLLLGPIGFVLQAISVLRRVVRKRTKRQQAVEHDDRWPPVHDQGASRSN